MSSIDKVVDIFLEADVYHVPFANEIIDEFILLDYAHVTREMIEATEYKIAKYLDKKWPEYSADGKGHQHSVINTWMEKCWRP